MDSNLENMIRKLQLDAHPQEIEYVAPPNGPPYIVRRQTTDDAGYSLYGFNLPSCRDLMQYLADRGYTVEQGTTAMSNFAILAKSNS